VGLDVWVIMYLCMCVFIIVVCNKGLGVAKMCAVDSMFRYVFLGTVLCSVQYA
jgi:hypothetical protein